jgi:hypothetical protein
MYFRMIFIGFLAQNWSVGENIVDSNCQSIYKTLNQMIRVRHAIFSHWAN